MVSIKNIVSKTKLGHSNSDVERGIDTYEIDRTILHIGQALRREWEDDVAQRRQFAQDNNKGREDASSGIVFFWTEGYQDTMCRH